MANDDKAKKRIAEAIDILGQFGLPSAQINERTAYCLLALLNVTPTRLGAILNLRLSVLRQ